MRSLLALVLVGLVLVGCAPLSRQVPAYPAYGQSPGQIQADMTDCEQWAKANTDEAGASAAGGAAVGAVVLGGIGAALGATLYALLHLDAGQGAAIGAAMGGITGATSGAANAGASAEQRQRGAYAACMSTRGYTVAP